MEERASYSLVSTGRHGHAIPLFLASTFLLSTSCGEMPPAQPNVVLIVVDTLRADALSYNGYWRETSPHLDALAKESVVFTNAFTGGTNTSTAMPGIMTARLPFFSEYEPPCEGPNCETRWNPRTQFGMHRFLEEEGAKGLPLVLDTLAELLGRDGYTTAGFVTNPFLKKQFHFDQGFDVYEEIFRDEYPVYGAGDDVTAAAVEFLDGDIEGPFFLYAHYMEPHAPYLPPEHLKDRFLSEQSIGLDDRDLFKGWETKVQLPNVAPEKLKAYVRVLYDAEVASVDASIGNLLQALKERDVFEKSIIVVTSDHGEEFWEHGKTGHPGRFFEEHLRVPLMIRAPQLDAARNTSLVRNFDIMPTVLDLVGTTFSPQGMDGESLVPLITSSSSQSERYTFANFPFPVTRRTFRDARYKLVVRVEEPEQNALYDLEEDPSEQRNLYSREDYLRVRHDLEERLAQLVEKLRSEGRATTGISSEGDNELDEATMRQLRALGYIE